tara:strand:- start:1109 stop:1357 length:249 start_codon:yes stop_codon:yes gene_type:complete
MRITNSEYDIILDSLGVLKKSLEAEFNKSNLVDSLVKKLENEYVRIAEINTKTPMTKEEEELYPSRLDTDYGGNEIGDKRVE